MKDRERAALLAGLAFDSAQRLPASLHPQERHLENVIRRHGKSERRHQGHDGVRGAEAERVRADDLPRKLVKEIQGI